MWDFFKELLTSHGLAAVVMVAVLIGAGWLIYHLLKSGRVAQQQLRDQTEAYTAALAAKGVRIAELEKEHAEEMRMVTEQFAERMDALQERRVEEAREVTKAVVKHVEQTKNAVEKITSAMETLSTVVSRR